MFSIVQDTEDNLMHSEDEYRLRLQTLNRGTKWAVVLAIEWGGGGIRELSCLLAKAEQERTPAVFRLDYHKLYISTQYCSDGIWGVRNARPSPPPPG